MRSKPEISTSPKPETVVSLQQKIVKLQIQIDGFKNKVLKLENKMLKQEQIILKLQAENRRLKEVKPIVSVNITGLHDKPPENKT